MSQTRQQKPAPNFPTQAVPQRKRVSDVAPVVHDVLRRPGQPLDAQTQSTMRPHFDHDFSQVRIHADGQATEAARAVNAFAFTVGRDVVFDAQQYAPHTQSGRRLIAHELAHVVQQGGQGVTLNNGLSIGRISDPAEIAAERAAGQLITGMTVANLGSSEPVLRRQHREILGLEEFDRAVPPPASPVRPVQDELLEALQAHEYRRFSERLHAMPLWERHSAYHDEDFLRQIRVLLPAGRILWNTLLFLRFGSELPSHVAQLRAAVYGRDADRVVALLRADPTLTDERQVPGVAIMLAHEFRGMPEYAAVLDAATQTVWAERQHIDYVEEAHYEYNEDTHSYEIQRRTNRVAYTLARTALELRVIVRIRFLHPQDIEHPLTSRGRGLFSVPAAKLAEWRSGIDSIWNNRFSAFNGTNRLRIIFQPMFDNTEQNPHHNVVIIDSPNRHRSNESHWWLYEDGRSIAHEFGHMIGNLDEYNLPGGIAEIPEEVCYPSGVGCIPLSAEEELHNSIEGLTGVERPPRADGYDLPTIMGTGREVRRRHVWPILEWFNANLRSADEAPFQLERS